jgi:AcrR family transcriptional regulator
MAAKNARSNAWQWSRTAQTRQTLLNAAREVFCEEGFANASIAEVVRRSNSSVGSVYHHFGGKTELFLMLWQDHEDAQEHTAAAAVAKARAAGEQDPLNLFIVGARAYMECSWRQRDLVQLFMNGDGPPGFELVRRTRTHDWVRQNAVLLAAGTGSVDRLIVGILTTFMGEASRQVATASNKRQANRITEAAIMYLRRLDPLDHLTT